MAQDQWTLQEKGKSQPAHGPPLQARVVAANRTVLAACVTILAHMVMNRGAGKSKHNGAKEELRAAGMDGKGGQANTASRTRPLQANTAGRRSDRHKP